MSCFDKGFLNLVFKFKVFFDPRKFLIGPTQFLPAQFSRLLVDQYIIVLLLCSGSMFPKTDMLTGFFFPRAHYLHDLKMRVKRGTRFTSRNDCRSTIFQKRF